MNELYSILPKVIPVGIPAALTIQTNVFEEGLTDGEYRVCVLPLNGRNMTNAPVPYIIKAEAGKLLFTHCFPTEQEYFIRIFKGTEEKALTQLSVYALAADLMERIPLMGDFHAHSTRSDGSEPPAFVAAKYRQAGFDFATITDHGMYQPSLDAIAAFQGLDTDFVLYPGEEVHSPHNPVHFINFAGDVSINREAGYFLHPKEWWGTIANDDWDAAVHNLVKSLPGLPQGVDAYTAASCVLVCKRIQEAGGMAIFCHPHWLADVYNVSDELSIYLLKNAVPDCFELLGGQTAHENMMQVNLWHQLQKEGYTIPVVGNSDSHTVYDTSYFSNMRSIVFAGGNTRDEIIEAVRMGYTTAVCGQKDHLQVYGDYRMTSFSQFLLRNYFPEHHSLCFEEGRLLQAHLGGLEPDVRQVLTMLKGRTARYRRRVGFVK